MTNKNNLLSKILYEAKSYNTFEDIEKLVDNDADLSMIPIQPLYVSLLSSTTEQMALVLPRLSPEQRQTFLDLDLWQKDRVDVFSFETWIETYSKVQDLELTQEFVSSEDFLIYLKSRVNIHTFDVEDPKYPDHDFYFLTDDNLLLIEYSEEYKYPNELKYLIRNLYDKLGVENAYSTLFKLINDSFSLIQEDGFQAKKERLRDFGFVDYYEALEKLHPFATMKQLDHFIMSQKALTPAIDSLSLNQTLHSSALTSFDSEMENIFSELMKVKDTKRLEFLHFTFVRLINSTITLKDALKGGRVELGNIGKQTKAMLELGLQKIHSNLTLSDEESVFNQFDFFDLYKVGNSLVTIPRQRLMKALKKSPFDSDDYEYFLGAWWGSFLEHSEKDIPQVKSFGAGLHAKKVICMNTHQFWNKQVNLFISMIPFINSFFESFAQLKEDGKLHDDFYLNYEVENIDFEAIIISSFINYSLGHFSENDVNKMGVSISELKSFFQQFFTKKDEEYVLLPMDSQEITTLIEAFLNRFGFADILDMDQYLYGIISEHLSGYDFDSLEDEDFKHIGGPILLNITVN